MSPSGCLKVHIYISQTQINLRPASHQLCTSISLLPVAISLLSPTQSVIYTSPSPEQQCLALFLHTAHWLQWLQYALHRTPDPFNLTTLCVSPCHSNNQSSLLLPGPVPGPCEPEDLIDGIIFAANYLGSTQLLSERNPSKNIRMMQAQEAVSRVKVLKKKHTHAPRCTDSHMQRHTLCLVFGLKIFISILLLSQQAVFLSVMLFYFLWRCWPKSPSN